MGEIHYIQEVILKSVEATKYVSLPNKGLMYKVSVTKLLYYETTCK